MRPVTRARAGAANEETTAARRSPAPSPCAVTIVAHDVGSVGGMERQLEELATGLQRLGHQVTVIARTCELPHDSGVRFHRVRAPRRPFLIAYPWFMVAGSLAVRRWRSGVVQATGAIVLNRVDTIAVHCCQQVYREAPRRSTLPYRLNRWLVGLLKRSGERFCFRANSAATFVCVSNGVADEIRDHYPRIAERVVTIHNGVDTAAFAPGVRVEQARALRATLGISQDRLAAVFVAREWGHKGLRAVIEAIARAPGWDLVVAGSGDRKAYQALADSLGVGDAVHWLGVMRDIQVAYEMADAFVLPSSYETFSLVTFEAAASGLPILATPVSGVRELLADGQNGFLITAEPSTIAERLTQLGDDPELRARLGESARRSVLEFSWAKMVARHDQLYARIAAAAQA